MKTKRECFCNDRCNSGCNEMENQSEELCTKDAKGIGNEWGLDFAEYWNKTNARCSRPKEESQISRIDSVSTSKTSIGENVSLKLFF